MKSETLDQAQEDVTTSEVPENLSQPPSGEEGPIEPTYDDASENVAEEGDAISKTESLEEKLEKATDQMKRQAAEFQNYRRRTEIEKRQMVSIGKSFVLEHLLDVFDDLQRSVTAAQDAESKTDSGTGSTFDAQRSFNSLRSGLELAHQKLMDELTKLDVIVVESVGQPFDEEVHEAVMQQPAKEGEEVGIVLAEVQRGFKLGDRVLRHAKVIVSS